MKIRFFIIFNIHILPNIANTAINPVYAIPIMYPTEKCLRFFFSFFLGPRSYFMLYIFLFLLLKSVQYRSSFESTGIDRTSPLITFKQYGRKEKLQ